MPERPQVIRAMGTIQQTCFVIQPFNAKYDKRFAGTFKPAIEAAGLMPYRVDRDPAVSIPIADIERGIQESLCCFADVSEDNPNVWFELGNALAAGKEVCIVCEDVRTKLPFDIQHRSIISYKSEDTSDFTKLRKAITERLSAILQKAQNRKLLPAKSAHLAEHTGLKEHEIATLICIAELTLISSPGPSTGQIAEEMDRIGYSRLATKLALEDLMGSGLLDKAIESGGFGEGYSVYFPSGKGLKWLSGNADKLPLKRNSGRPPSRSSSPNPEGDPPF